MGAPHRFWGRARAQRGAAAIREADRLFAEVGPARSVGRRLVWSYQSLPCIRTRPEIAAGSGGSHRASMFRPHSFQLVQRSRLQRQEALFERATARAMVFRPARRAVVHPTPRAQTPPLRCSAPRAGPSLSPPSLSGPAVSSAARRSGFPNAAAPLVPSSRLITSPLRPGR